jgi:hypothetical protein
MTLPTHASLRFAALCLGLALAGCGLFSTREPEPPKAGGNTFVPPTTPDIVLTNMQHAVSEKDAANYLRCLPDTLNSSRTFSFAPSAAAAGRYVTTFLFWSLQSEKSYFSALVALTPSSSSSSLNITGGFSVITTDSAIYNGDYQLTFQHGLSGVPETVRGNLQFVLVTDRTSLWSIVRWIDNPIGSDPSWSDLKGRFAN